MIDKERKQVQTINTFLKEAKTILEKIRKAEAARFINMPKNFVKKGCDFDERATRLADTLAFLEECTEHLDEVVALKG